MAFVRLAVVVLWAALLPHGAAAHAVLLATSPADGALLVTAPAAVVLTFNEPVGPLSIRLIAPDGTAVDVTGTPTRTARLEVPLGPLGRGSHVLSWRVVSDDGHPVAGALVFSVGEPTGGAAVSQGAPGVRPAIWAARLAMTAGLVLAVGSAVFTGRAAPRVALAAAVATVLLLGLQGLDALGLGFPALLSPAPWAAAAGTSLGPSVALAVAAAVLAVAGARWAALVLLGAAFAVSGHAGTADPRWLTRPLVFVHIVTLTAWIGALVPLALALRRPHGTEALRRFSAAIPWAVALLLASGVALSAIQLGPEPALWLAPYGLILAAKLALLALLLALAAWNRWHLTGPVLAGDAGAVQRMRRSIGGELVLALLILGLVAGWRFTPPPRALAQAVVPAAHAHLMGGPAMAAVEVVPGRPGPVAVEIRVTDLDGNPLVPLAVTLSLSSPDRGIERIARAAEPGTEAGAWHIDGLVLPLGGVWEVEAEVRLTRFSQTTLSGSLEIE